MEREEQEKIRYSCRRGRKNRKYSSSTPRLLGLEKNLRCSKYVENYATRGLSSGELEQNMAEKRSEEMSKMMSPIKNPMKKPFWSGEGGRRRRKKALSYHDGSSAGKEDDSYTLFFLVEEGRWQNGRCILRLDNFAGKESGK